MLENEQRSHLMPKIKQKNTLPELTVRCYLFFNGFWFKVNLKKLPGTPDIVLPKYRTLFFLFMVAFGMDILVRQVKCQKQIWIIGIKK